MATWRIVKNCGNSRKFLLRCIFPVGASAAYLLLTDCTSMEDPIPHSTASFIIRADRVTFSYVVEDLRSHSILACTKVSEKELSPKGVSVLRCASSP